jgi:hypothetical protein
MKLINFFLVESLKWEKARFFQIFVKLCFFWSTYGTETVTCQKWEQEH